MVSTMTSETVRNTKWGCGHVERDVDTIVAAFDRIGLNAVVVASRWFTGEWVVVPPVPRTTEEPFLDRPLAKRSFLVRALVVECCVLPFVVCHAHGCQPAGDGFDPAFGKLVELERLVPNSLGLSHPSSSLREASSTRKWLHRETHRPWHAADPDHLPPLYPIR